MYSQMLYTLHLYLYGILGVFFFIVFAVALRMLSRTPRTSRPTGYPLIRVCLCVCAFVYCMLYLLSEENPWHVYPFEEL